MTDIELLEEARANPKAFWNLATSKHRDWESMQKVYTSLEEACAPLGYARIRSIGFLSRWMEAEPHTGPEWDAAIDRAIYLRQQKSL